MYYIQPPTKIYFKVIYYKLLNQNLCNC